MTNSNNPLANLQPQLIWQHFYTLTQIPRPTFAEERVRQHIIEWAKQRDYKTTTDKKGNLLVTVPTQGKPAKTPQLILQSHIDMVCEQDPDSHVDPRRQPLDVYVDNDWVKARGTTLGADNGIGVAGAMAIADDTTLKRGPLQLLFTVEEEVGLTGAKELDANFLQGRYLINLDGSINALAIACAGTFNATLTLPLLRQTKCPTGACYELRITGLKGGHSGNDIHEARGNAIRLLTTLLQELHEQSPLQLSDISGGQSPNAIPRNAQCHLWIEAQQLPAFQQHLQQRQDDWRQKSHQHLDEPTLEILLTPVSNATVLTPLEDPAHALNLLAALPNGPLEFSQLRAGYPETSNNVGIVETKVGELVITVKGRSRTQGSLKNLRRQIGSIAVLAKAAFNEFSYTPPWSGTSSSPFIEVCQTAYQKLCGSKLPTKVIHGVIECGHFAAKAPHLEMIAIGGEMQECHSPNERLRISSVPKFYAVLQELVEQFSA